MSQVEISPEILETLQRLSTLLEPDPSLQNTLQSVAELSVAAVGGCESAGVTLRPEHHHITAAASDDYTLEIDKIQYETGEGPCVAAMEESRFMQIETVAEEKRWPQFCRQAAGKGFKSCLSYPLDNNGTPGTLNIYARTERAFSESDIALGHLVASQASAALDNAQVFQASRHLADELQEALKSRDVIGQAKGILIERESLSDSEAFEMLKTLSQTTNTKLREVAQRLVDETIKKHGLGNDHPR